MKIISNSSAALYTTTLKLPCVIKTLSWIHEGTHICEKYGIRIRNILKREHETPKIGGAKIHSDSLYNKYKLTPSYSRIWLCESLRLVPKVFLQSKQYLCLFITKENIVTFRRIFEL